MAEPVCEKCGGAGFITIDDLNVEQCKCFKKKAIRAYLGPEIYAAPTPVGGSLFFRHVQGKEPVDKTRENLVIRGYWAQVLPHLKWALAAKADRSQGMFPKYSVITDERLKTVFVGAESYNQRARSKRDDVQTYNSLADIVGAEYELIIIRLGNLGHKNIAMPGALKEALMLREVALKPTWLIDDPHNPFVPGHLAYSDDVYDYVSNHFEYVDISNEVVGESAVPVDVEDMSSTPEEEAEEVVVAPPQKVRRMPVSTEVSVDKSSDAISNYAVDFPTKSTASKKKFGKKQWGNK